jgi:hypothetical protein
MTKTLISIKSILIGFLFFFFFVHSSFSQIRIGAKLGPTFANINGGNASHNNHFRLGGHIGMYGQYKFNDKMGVQVELLFNQKGTINRNEPNSWVRINYLDFPILFTYEFIEGLTGQAGLQFSTALGAYEDREGHARRYFLHDINKTVVSLPLGIVYELQNGINFGLRADIGLSQIGNDGAKNNAILLSVGYTFYKGGSTSAGSSGKKK